eukprot:s759_g18.t1
MWTLLSWEGVRGTKILSDTCTAGSFSAKQKLAWYRGLVVKRPPSAAKTRNTAEKRLEAMDPLNVAALLSPEVIQELARDALNLQPGPTASTRGTTRSVPRSPLGSPRSEESRRPRSPGSPPPLVPSARLAGLSRTRTSPGRAQAAAASKGEEEATLSLEGRRVPAFGSPSDSSSPAGSPGGASSPEAALTEPPAADPDVLTAAAPTVEPKAEPKGEPKEESTAKAAVPDTPATATPRSKSSTPTVQGRRKEEGSKTPSSTVEDLSTGSRKTLSEKDAASFAKRLGEWAKDRDKRRHDLHEQARSQVCYEACETFGRQEPSGSQEYGLWHPVTRPLPCTQLLLFSPSLAVLSGTAFPHGLPDGVTRIFPLSVADQQQAEVWQTTCHQSLEEQIGSKVHGYVSLRVSRPLGRAPLLVRELPETVGSKVWRGAWLLWKCLANLHGLGGISRVLELGAGVGLVGLLLAADHSLEVVVSETRTGYGGAELTWENLVYNVQMNAEQIAEGGGRIEALELDWTQGLQDQVRKFDLVVGSDILYEPHLFEDLLDVMQTAASEAVLVQNVARKGTQYFKELCRARNIGLRAVDVSNLDANEQWLVEGVADAVDGVYQCWFLDFSQARSGSDDENFCDPEAV